MIPGIITLALVYLILAKLHLLTKSRAVSSMFFKATTTKTIGKTERVFTCGLSGMNTSARRKSNADSSAQTVNE